MDARHGNDSRGEAILRAYQLSPAWLKRNGLPADFGQWSELAADRGEWQQRLGVRDPCLRPATNISTAPHNAFINLSCLLNKKVFFRSLTLRLVNFKNLDASSTFNVNTMGENQASASDLFSRIAVSKLILGWRLTIEGGTVSSATGVGEL